MIRSQYTATHLLQWGREGFFAMPLFALCLCSLAPSSASSGPPGLESLRWMTACWQLDNAEAGSGEQWMMPAGGLMLGMGRTIRDGDAVAYEFMRIELEQGKRVFVAQPQGGVATRFPELEHSHLSVSFANPQHDFPQRIVYSRKGDRLLATLSGENSDATGDVRLMMHKVACDGVRP